MDKYIEKRILACADYYIENESTVRETAKIFDISKTTVHINLSQDLKKLDRRRYRKARRILDKHKKEFNKKHKIRN